ncbi:MAG: hypothetical protein HKN95_09090, partial [Acidimicrobiia bacterium]|nr:hypothetical protein [Acidimicrobiia bacterium]
MNVNPVGGNLSDKPDDPGGAKAGGSDPSGVGGRPGWVGLLAAGAVVLVVGGFALSRDYGVQSIPSPPSLEEIATPTTSGSIPPPDTTVPASGLATDQSGSIFSMSFDRMYEVIDMDVALDGSVYVAAPAGVAWRWSAAGDWVLTDMDALPVGTGWNDGWPGRTIDHVAAAGPEIDMDGFMWVAGSATSHADDEEFGGIVDGWTGGRILQWVARYHCPVCDEWTVWTTNQVPELADGIGDLVVSPDGMVYASVGENLLMMFDGKGWTSFAVPLPPSGGVAYPWSSSLAVGTDGVVWAGYNYRNGGVLSFDGTDFTRYTTEDGLPSNNEIRVSAAGDGTIWAATERSGVARFDGTSWTSYTTANGLLSNQAVIAAGYDGTVWAVHLDDPPYGYSRFDGSGWTTYPFNFEVGAYRAEVGPDGRLWTISDEGLISFDGTTRTFFATPFGPLVPGTITISIDGWEGVEGYRLLAVVSSESDLVGGAFWTIIDSDPYTRTDMVHPPFDGEDPPGVEYETWGDGDYSWDKTAMLEPGTYQIDFLANPDELAPYGSHLPASPIERECSIAVEVAAGRN